MLHDAINLSFVVKRIATAKERLGCPEGCPERLSCFGIAVVLVFVVSERSLKTLPLQNNVITVLIISSSREF